MQGLGRGGEKSGREGGGEQRGQRGGEKVVGVGNRRAR